MMGTMSDSVILCISTAIRTNMNKALGIEHGENFKTRNKNVLCKILYMSLKPML